MEGDKYTVIETTLSPVEIKESFWNKLKNKIGKIFDNFLIITGAAGRAVASNYAFGIGRENPNQYTGSLRTKVLVGQALGDLATIILGGLEIGVGNAGVGGGGVLSATGVGAGAGVLLATASGGLIAHGISVGVQGSPSLGTTLNLLFSSNSGDSGADSSSESASSGSGNKIKEKVETSPETPLNKGTQVNSKTSWKGKGKERIDVENPKPGQRPGQIHYQDNSGNKYIYDPSTGKFKDAPKKVNEMLNDPKFKRGIEKGLEYLGY